MKRMISGRLIIIFGHSREIYLDVGNLWKRPDDRLEKSTKAGKYNLFIF